MLQRALTSRSFYLGLFTVCAISVGGVLSPERALAQTPREPGGAAEQKKACVLRWTERRALARQHAQRLDKAARDVLEGRTSPGQGMKLGDIAHEMLSGADAYLTDEEIRTLCLHPRIMHPLEILRKGLFHATQD